MILNDSHPCQNIWTNTSLCGELFLWAPHNFPELKSIPTWSLSGTAVTTLASLSCCQVILLVHERIRFPHFSSSEIARVFLSCQWARTLTGNSFADHWREWKNVTNLVHSGEKDLDRIYKWSSQCETNPEKKTIWALNHFKSRESWVVLLVCCIMRNRSTQRLSLSSLMAHLGLKSSVLTEGRSQWRHDAPWRRRRSTS